MLYRINRIIIFFALLLLCFFLLSCSKEPEEVYREKLTELKAGKIAISEMRNPLIESCAVLTTKADFPVFTQKVILEKTEDAVVFLYPFQRSVKIESVSSLKIFDITETSSLVSDGINILIYDNQGRKINEIKPPESDASMMAASFFKGHVAVYRGRGVEFYDKNNADKPDFIKAFKPPYSRDFSVYFFRSAEALGVLTGSAGYYYFSVLNEKGKVKIENIKVSSSRLRFTGDTLQYISGGANSWKLTEYNIKSRRKKVKEKLKNLQDVFILKHGYIAQKDKGRWILKTGDSVTELPFDLSPVAQCRGQLVFYEKGRVVVCDTGELCSKIKILSKSLPQAQTPESP